MKFSIDTLDLERVRLSFATFSDRRFRAGLATALTRTAQGGQADEQREIRDVFDRPTPFTEGQIFVRRATADNLVAEFGISDQPYTVGYLKPHVFGGPRRLKGFEKLLVSAGAMPSSDMRAVPARFARLDAFGNISAGQIRQILSQLRIEPTQGATSALPRLSGGDRAALRDAAAKGARGPVNKSAVKAAQAKRNRINSAYRRAGGQFVAFPFGRGKLRPGIYQVRATAFGRSDPKPVIIFVTRANYEAERFDFFYVAGNSVAKRLNPAISAAMAEQLQRWAAKYGTAA